MITAKTNHPLNTFVFLSEEMERTLRLRAWKDEIFRKALIADPKGVIQRLFPQCFPNGKLPEELTIKVIEQDSDTCHIILPPLPDEFPILEIPEEEHLELLAYMGRLESKDSPEKKRQSQSSDKQPDFTKESFKRQQVKENKENIPVSGAHHDSREAAKLPTEKEWRQACSELSQNKELLQELQKENDPKRVMQMLVEKYFPNYKLPKDVTFKVFQDKPDTRHIVLPSSRDDFKRSGFSRETIDNISKKSLGGEGYGPSEGCSTDCSTDDNC